MKSTEIKSLLNKYFEGNTSLKEEEILKIYFSGENIAEEFQSYKDHFQFFNALDEKMTRGILNDDELIKNVFKDRHKTDNPIIPINKKNASPLPWLRYAAGMALLVLGFTAGYFVKDVDVAATVGDVNTNQMNTHSQVVLAGLNNQSSASERILAINESLEMQDISQEIAQALIKTMNFDDNINVRLAAIEALARYTNRDDVRTSLIRSLEIQENPIIQIALIDLLVKMDEKKAINEIQRLMIDEKTQDVVKQRAEVGVSLLM